MVAAGAHADLPHDGLASPREGRDQSRLEHVVQVSVPCVLVLAEGVDRALPRQDTRVYGPGVHLFHLAVEPVDPV